jgi:hypothetical protein
MIAFNLSLCVKVTESSDILPIPESTRYLSNSFAVVLLVISHNF